MALITCPKCSHQVEPSERECPKCGIIFKKYQEGVLKAQKAFEEKAKQAQKKLTKCRACTNTISMLASTCPRCGEPRHVPAPTAGAEDKSGATLFDFQFDHFITPQLIKIFYVFVIVAGLIGCLSTIVSSLFSPFDPLRLILAIVSYLLLVLFTRIACESVLLLFKIEKNTR